MALNQSKSRRNESNYLQSLPIYLYGYNCFNECFDISKLLKNLTQMVCLRRLKRL